MLVDDRAYLFEKDGKYYSIVNGALEETGITDLTATMFLEYGFLELPQNMTHYIDYRLLFWKSDGDVERVKAQVRAQPYPQALESVIDMSHISIRGIKLITAEFSGDVTVRCSIDNGATFSEEESLGEWLNIEPEELYNSLPENKMLFLHFILHGNAAISRFKITYIN